jgi:adenine deaminase
MVECDNFIKHICYGIPKAELHIHIEGTFEPELVIQLAKKNGNTKFNDIDELRNKYKFTCLKDFLDLYYNCCDVLVDEEDFEALMFAYLKKASSQGLKYAEIFFDPQTHTSRGVEFKTVISGLSKGIKAGKKEFGIEAQLIMCFLRDLTEDDAFKTFEVALEFKDMFIAVGLDSNEIGNSSVKFVNVFRLAKEKGFRIVIHAGEEASIPVEYIYDALDKCKAERIDHGVQVIKCNKLMDRLANDKIPLTVCPLSNVKLNVHKDVSESPLKIFLDKGILCMINSDDPAYFGGYIGDNYYECAIKLKLDEQDLLVLAMNSFKASFLSDDDKESYIKQVNDFLSDLKVKNQLK